MDSPTDAALPQLPSFRPGKKRKIYRQRTEDTDNATPPTDAPVSTAQPDSAPEPRLSEDSGPTHDGEDEVVPISVIRRQAARRGRLGGVAFRAGSARAEEQSQQHTEQSLVPHGGNPLENDVLGGITKRFAPQTGLVGELVNKHMEEYIEAELAKRHAVEAAAAAAAAATGTGTHTDSAALAAGATDASILASTGKPVVQPAMQGKLMEIDLGDEARARNVAMTERARRRALGEAVEEEDDGAAAGSSRPRKVRLGRDGKPWRGRNRRNSEDVKRDQLVEEFLKENRLDVYDLPPAQTSAAAGSDLDDEGADDKIAEEFKREFMDAMNQRQQRRRPAVNAKPPPRGAAQEEVLKGPKLGGSRNQRAVMRNILLKQQEAKR